MWLTSLSIRRPVCILMVVSALIVLGLRAFVSMKVELNPKVDFPFISIVTAYPGAGPPEIETQVTRRIEDAVSGVYGIKLIASTSQEERSAVNIEFKTGTSSDAAVSDVRERLASIRADLPANAKPPVILKFDVNTQPILYYGITGNRPSRELRDLTDHVIKPRLGKVSGVAVVSVTGGDERAIRIDVRKQRLQAYGLRIQQIVDLLKANNLNLPAGHIVEGGREYSVRVVGEFPAAAAIAATRFRTAEGRTIRLSDIADIKDTMAERREITRFNGKDSIGLVIRKTSDSNTSEVAQGVRNEMSLLRDQLPKDVVCEVNQDASVDVENDVVDMKYSLLLGASLAVLVVYLFLHDIRGTFIVAISIPTSILATFLPMYAFGFSLNTITLLALSLSVGILVDDSIVVLESILRHLARGEDPVEAAINGRSEIGLAAIAITLVDIVVFVPLAFMGGITGQFFWPFGVTVACATFFSLLISFTLTPMLAAYWYAPGNLLPGRQRFSIRFDRFYYGIERLYRNTLAHALSFRGIAVYASTALLILMFTAIAASVWGTALNAAAPGIALLFVIGGAVMLRRNGFAGFAVTVCCVAAVFVVFAAGTHSGAPLLLFRFAPGQDQGQVAITGELPTGTSLDRTLKVAKRVENVTISDPAMKSVFTSIGTMTAGAWGLAGAGPQYFTMNLKLQDKMSLLDWINPFANRARLRTRSDTQIAEDLRRQIGIVPGANIKLAAVSSFYAVGKPLQVNILGNNQAELEVLGENVLQVFEREPGVLNPDISTRPGKPEVRIEVDRIKTASYGLSVEEVATALRTSLEGDTTNIFRQNGNEYDIRVQYADTDRRNIAEIRDSSICVAARGNEPMRMIRLSDVARVSLSTSPTKIDRIDRQRMVSVTANISPGFAPGNAQLSIDRQLRGIDFRSNSWKWDGENRVVQEEWHYLAGALALSIVLVYVLMAALFDNLLYPLVIMASLPQAMVGALLALIVTRQALTVVAMTGIIMLMGLVTKNAILLVDYTNTLRGRRLSRTDALLEAGQTRLRPILMTTLTMIAGMLPTAMGLGRGAEFRAPLAIPVIGGLILSTLLTLIVIPSFYIYFDDVGRILQRRKPEACIPETNIVVQNAAWRIREHTPREDHDGMSVTR